MRSQLKKIEDLGAAMEEALILDNKYTEHSTVGLAQQWDQLDQLGMRMQHNLEQQIQARCAPPGPPSVRHSLCWDPADFATCSLHPVLLGTQPE